MLIFFTYLFILLFLYIIKFFIKHVKYRLFDLFIYLSLYLCSELAFEVFMYLFMSFPSSMVQSTTKPCASTDKIGPVHTMHTPPGALHTILKNPRENACAIYDCAAQSLPSKTRSKNPKNAQRDLKNAQRNLEIAQNPKTALDIYM